MDVDAARFRAPIQQSRFRYLTRARDDDAGHRRAVLSRHRGPCRRGRTARPYETHGSHDPIRAGARCAESGAACRADAPMSALLIAADSLFPINRSADIASIALRQTRSDDVGALQAFVRALSPAS